MDDSILTSIKKMSGIEEDCTQFDQDITIHINSSLLSLNQIGVGPEEGYFITDKTQQWTDFLSTRKDIEAVKTLIYLKVKLVFDPPSTSFVIDAIERHIKELEWRLNVQIENTMPDPVVVEEGGTV